MKKFCLAFATMLGCLCLALAIVFMPATAAKADEAETVSLLDMNKPLIEDKSYPTHSDGWHGLGDLGWGRQWHKPEIVLATGSNGEAANVLKMGFSYSWGGSNGTVVFDTPIALADVEKLEMKVYANLSTQDNYYDTT